MGNYSAFDAQNPILNSNPRPPNTPPIVEPSYYSYFLHADVGGPMTKTSSFFSSVFNRNEQNQVVVDAIDPASITAANPNGTPLNETVPNPSNRLDLSQRFDFQLGQSNSVTGHYDYYRSSFTNGSVGITSPPRTGHQWRESGEYAAGLRQPCAEQELRRQHPLSLPPHSK